MFLLELIRQFIYSPIEIRGRNFELFAFLLLYEIAAALKADKLIFLTNVPGIYDESNQLIKKLTPKIAKELIASGVASGGMDAKIESCLIEAKSVKATQIIDGRVPHILIKEIDGKGNGTTIAK